MSRVSRHSTDSLCRARKSRTVFLIAVVSVLAVCLVAHAGESLGELAAGGEPGSRPAASGEPGSQSAAGGESGSQPVTDGEQGSLDYQLIWRDELVYNLLGSPVATIELEMLRSAEGPARLASRNYYGAQATEVVTEWEFDEVTPPIAFRRYSLSVSAPGVKLDALIAWDDEVTFEVVQTGTKGVFAPPVTDPSTAVGPGSHLTVVPLDNNALADYLVATWLLPSTEPGERGEFGLVLPVSLTQHSMVLSSTVEYLGLDDFLGREALKHRVSVGGTEVVIWSTRDERRLVKLHIASQGIEIVNEALLEEWSAVREEPVGAAELEATPLDAAEPGAVESGDAELATAESVIDEPVAGTMAGEAFETSIVEKEVQVPVRGGSLAATLSFPADATGKVPGVVIVAGSGPTDRDGNNPLTAGQINTYKEVAHHLVSRGIAVLRYDKRGIAESAGLVSSETPPFDWFAEDVASCVEFLKSVEEVKSDSVFIAGHSEGGVLALMAAASGSEVTGLILLSTPGYSLRDTYRLQVGAQGDALESMGVTGMKGRMLAALDDLYEAIRTGGPFDYSIYGLPQEYAAFYLPLDLQREFAEGFLSADSAELAGQVDVPICIIQGTADTQVSVDNALALVASIGDPDKVEAHIIEGVDHVLKPTEGEPLPYGDPSRRVSPEVLKAIEGFVTP